MPLVELSCEGMLLGGARDLESDAPELRQDFFVFWETVRFVLGEDHVSVDNDVEDPSTAAHQFGFDAGLTFDAGCQTGSPG